MSAPCGRLLGATHCRAPRSLLTRASATRWSSSAPAAAAGAEWLRVAVVGGGAAGLSAALHLAPLVAAGKVAAPIDVFDAPPPGAAPPSRARRDIGVGLWSTALDPFRPPDDNDNGDDEFRTSHRVVYEEMVRRGTWLGDVGYRTPNGAWLMRSHLPTTHDEAVARRMPGLLFLRERDMLAALETAVHWEEQVGTIRLHREGHKTRATGLQEDSSLPWSTRIRFDSADNGANPPRLSDRDYHLVIAADGVNSVLRQRYGGHFRTRAIGALSTPIDLPQDQHSGPVASWPAESNTNQHYAVGIQDRNYTVFRGNAPLRAADLGPDGATSFQTWGTGHSMRFATVPMRYPGPQQATEERQVWFVTINDAAIDAEPDPLARRSRILEAFRDWHHPVCRIIEATPPEEILMTRAIAHRHSVGPVCDFNSVVRQSTGRRPPSAGEGPCLVFTGDACMTIDPILAQGFTFAMEGAHTLRRVVEAGCVPSPREPSLAFDPQLLREQIRARHEDRLRRLVCLLRVTELVQALGQPAGGTLLGRLHTHLLRPLTRLAPDAVKTPLFDAVLKYSLNYSGEPELPVR